MQQFYIGLAIKQDNLLILSFNMGSVSKNLSPQNHSLGKEGRKAGNQQTNLTWY
jgi:hypothetical protein